MIDFKTYLEMEDETNKETMRKFRKESKLYERLFDLCSETIDYLYDKTERKRPSTGKLATLLVLPRIMQSMQSIRLLKLKGYYYDASVLERSFLESIGLCAYLSLNGEEAKNWIQGRKPKMATIKLLDYIPKLFDSSDPKIDVKPIYGELCDYVHSNTKAILSYITPKESPKLTVDFISGFAEDKAIGFVVLPKLVILMLSEIFWNELTSNKKNRIAKFLSASSQRELTPKQRQNSR